VNKKKVWIAALSICLLSTLATYHYGIKNKLKGSPDDALLSLIKNDLGAFEAYLNAGGDVHDRLPTIDGKTMTVAQGLAYFERAEFIKLLQAKKKLFVLQDAEQDIMTIAVQKNNLEVLNLLLIEKPNLGLKYGTKKMTLLHLASDHCSHKLTGALMNTGKFKWNDETKQGSNALILASEKECLPMLTYWKEKGADFNKKNHRGISAMKVLGSKKDQTIMTFLQSFQVRAPASVPSASRPGSFYKKRIDPKDMPVDYSALIEPAGRPEEEVETAAKSEFAD